MNSPAQPSSRLGWRKLRFVGLALTGAMLLTGCPIDDDDDSSASDERSAPLTSSDGQLQANIRRTTNGVPHIKADDLSSAAFGLGYAQAQDNVCLLAEAIVKARSERSKYFGPRGSLTDPNDPPRNVISDFSYKAQRILSGAEEEYPGLSDQSLALINGFTAGYNKYVLETDPSDLPAECRGQPWVKEIRPQDLLAHYRVVGQYGSGDAFATGAVFVAVPPGESPSPTPVMPVAATDLNLESIAASAIKQAGERKDFNNIGLASNAWGIGRELTEQGRGALLANPHFPYTGPRRLYQAQMTVPGYLNINGAGLLGTAIPLINYNENLGWSHTVTTSSQFTIYELTLKQGDNLTYIKDGEEKAITSETFEIEVNVGAPNPIVLEKTFYYSEYGPMVSLNAATGGGLPSWGGTNQGNTVAYTYRDANANTGNLLDGWLGMSRASNLEEFQDVFRNCGSTFWTNSTYADADGNAFYIDSSSVPNLSQQAQLSIEFKRRASASYDALFNAGLILLDGSTSRDDWVEGACGGLVPYEQKPKLLRSDWVQNSNDSYWSTNPDELLTGFSPLYGNESSALGPRTRIGISMLQNPMDAGFADKAPAGQDGKFSAQDLIEVIYNNRSWYAEEFLGELRERCTAIGADLVNLPEGGSRSVEQACDVLANWDGVYDIDSVGAHVFRVFIDNYNEVFDEDLTVRFKPSDPVGTPTAPSTVNKGTADDVMLQSLAVGLDSLDSVGIAYDAELGDVQYFQPSGGVLPGPAGGSPMVLSPRIPWHGGDGGIDGTFNAIGVVSSAFAEDTVIPRLPVNRIGNTGGLSNVNGINNQRAGWPMERGTSWHFGLEFTDEGPKAFGLVSYSQSTDSMSEFFTDQSVRYSMKDYREFPFTEEEIQANLIDQGEINISN
ncbi:penicillin acylase family protein [Marinobacter confluentis]|uniref:Penicillin acylase family protein n=1 Tax=Marinobacter confluentis TaxID=1697557 RepID=A0A4Z1BRH8_9GAMM|nr:penicillin acylase family protein [Marinobacter confluentis]TGN39849.1 penicillin acylase family protein [Marinobacter confluentis]